MLSFKRYLCMIGLIGLSAAASAQQSPKTISLRQLLTQVDQKAPSLLTDSAAILIKKAQAVEVKNNWLPNLKLNYQADVGTANNTTGPYFGFGIIPSSSGAIHPTNVTTTMSDNFGIAAFDWEVYNFGAYGAQNKVANSDVDVQQNQFAQNKYNLQAFAIINYLQLLRLQDFVAIQQRNIQRNEEISRSIESLAKSGVRAGVDTSIAEAELSKARLDYIELVNQQKQVQLQLASVSGLPYTTIVADTTAVQKMIGSPQATTGNLDTANHPLINYYKSVRQNSLEREDLVRKMYNPKILLEGAAWGRASSVDAAGNYNSLSSGYGLQRENYLVGVGISYNLFDLKRKQLKLSTQRAVTDYADKQLEEQKQLLAITNGQADVEMQTAIQRLQEIPHQLNAAQAGYRQKLSLYRSGLTDIVELDAALNILYRAETDYAQAKYAYTNALFQKAVTGNTVGTVLNLLNP